MKAASVSGCPERRSPLPTWPDAKGTGAAPRLVGQPHEYISKTLMNWSKERGRDPTKPDSSAVCDCIIECFDTPISRDVNAALSR
jgi:hypothetical protein